MKKNFIYIALFCNFSFIRPHYLSVFMPQKALFLRFPGHVVSVSEWYVVGEEMVWFERVKGMVLADYSYGIGFQNLCFRRCLSAIKCSFECSQMSLWVQSNIRLSAIAQRCECLGRIKQTNLILYFLLYILYKYVKIVAQSK